MGTEWCAARLASCTRLLVRKGSELTKSPSTRTGTKVARAASISRLVLALRTWICNPRDAPPLPHLLTWSRRWNRSGLRGRPHEWLQAPARAKTPVALPTTPHFSLNHLVGSGVSVNLVMHALLPRGGNHAKVAQLDQRTALADQCLHSAEADVRLPRRRSGVDKASGLLARPQEDPAVPLRLAPTTSS